MSSGGAPCLGMLLLVKFDACVHVASHVSGGFRNVERGVQSKNFWIATPTSGHVGSPN